MKESKLIEMQKRIEILGAALKNIEKTAGQSKQKENVEQPVEKRN